MTEDELRDLTERLVRASDTLHQLAASTTDEAEKARLLAKREGITVTLDYLRGYGS